MHNFFDNWKKILRENFELDFVTENTGSYTGPIE